VKSIYQHITTSNFPFIFDSVSLIKFREKKQTIIIICRQSISQVKIVSIIVHQCPVWPQPRSSLRTFIANKLTRRITTAALPILLRVELRRQKFKVILISNERSKNVRIQFALTITNDDVNFKQRSNSSLMQIVHGVNWFQFTDSENLTENYPADDLYTSKFQFRMNHRWIHRKWRHTMDVSWLDGSHHVTRQHEQSFVTL